MKIYIGADHKGYELKGKVAKHLFSTKQDFTDLGADFLDPNDDYTKYVSEVASLVANEKGSRGIVLCGSGVGADITANKFDGVRAAIGKSVEQVRSGRNDDNMNVLVIAADFTTGEEAKKMVSAFLETKFSGKSRFERRLQDIEKIEANN